MTKHKSLLNNNLLKIALPKGRILDELKPLLLKANLCEERDFKKLNRELFFVKNNIQFIIVRAFDVPAFIEHGGVDAGITGKDSLLEHETQNIFDMLDLEISQCKLMTAFLASKEPAKKGSQIKVASKFKKIAKEFYASLGIHAELIKLNGAMELAPVVGLVDEIVDIVSTGKTLKANGLVPCHEIMTISSRFMCNKVSYKLKHQQLNDIVVRLDNAKK